MQHSFVPTMSTLSERPQVNLLLDPPPYPALSRSLALSTSPACTSSWTLARHRAWARRKSNPYAYLNNYPLHLAPKDPNRWPVTEHCRFLSALRLLPRLPTAESQKWAALAPLLPGRSGSQIRRYFHRVGRAGFINHDGTVKRNLVARAKVGGKESATALFRRSALLKFVPKSLPDVDDSSLYCVETRGYAESLASKVASQEQLTYWPPKTHTVAKHVGGKRIINCRPPALSKVEGPATERKDSKATKKPGRRIAPAKEAYNRTHLKGSKSLKCKVRRSRPTIPPSSHVRKKAASSKREPVPRDCTEPEVVNTTESADENIIKMGGLLATNRSPELRSNDLQISHDKILVRLRIRKIAQCDALPRVHPKPDQVSQDFNITGPGSSQQFGNQNEHSSCDQNGSVVSREDFSIKKGKNVVDNHLPKAQRKRVSFFLNGSEDAPSQNVNLVENPSQDGGGEGGFQNDRAESLKTCLSVSLGKVDASSEGCLSEEHFDKCEGHLVPKIPLLVQQSMSTSRRIYAPPRSVERRNISSHERYIFEGSSSASATLPVVCSPSIESSYVQPRSSDVESVIVTTGQACAAKHPEERGKDNIERLAYFSEPPSSDEGEYISLDEDTEDYNHVSIAESAGSPNNATGVQVSEPAYADSTDTVALSTDSDEPATTVTKRRIPIEFLLCHDGENESMPGAHPGKRRRVKSTQELPLCDEFGSAITLQNDLWPAAGNRFWHTNVGTDSCTNREESMSVSWTTMVWTRAWNEAHEGPDIAARDLQTVEQVFKCIETKMKQIQQTLALFVRTIEPIGLQLGHQQQQLELLRQFETAQETILRKDGFNMDGVFDICTRTISRNCLPMNRSRFICGSPLFCSKQRSFSYRQVASGLSKLCDSVCDDFRERLEDMEARQAMEVLAEKAIRSVTCLKVAAL